MRSLYKELEEERNAAAISANQAMAMINRLQKVFYGRTDGAQKAENTTAIGSVREQLAEKARRDLGCAAIFVRAKKKKAVSAPEAWSGASADNAGVGCFGGDGGRAAGEERMPSSGNAFESAEALLGETAQYFHQNGFDTLGPASLRVAMRPLVLQFEKRARRTSHAAANMDSELEAEESMNMIGGRSLAFSIAAAYRVSKRVLGIVHLPLIEIRLINGLDLFQKRHVSACGSRVYPFNSRAKGKSAAEAFRMTLQSLISLTIFFFFFSSCSLALAQQLYTEPANAACPNAESSTSLLGYRCNGQNPTCQAYLIFRSQPPLNTPNSISTLLSADPFQISSINSVSNDEIIATNKEVIVPVNCSCSGQYYQHNSSYTTASGDGYFIIANSTYQGLSTCQALGEQNRNPTTELRPGMEIRVPLRCACPTRNQSSDGVKYLLSYSVTWKDNIWGVSQRFGVSTQSCLDANGLSEAESTIYPFTTVLVPLQNPPTVLMTIAPPPPQPSPPPPNSSTEPENSSKKTWVYVVIGIAAGGFMLAASLVIFCIIHKRKKDNSLPIFGELEEGEKSLKKSAVPEELLEEMSSIERALKVYNLKELELATKNFGTMIKGSVYRGVLKGDVAAIKKMNSDASKEIELLKTINHSNLIELSGICFDFGQWYLVYEYAEKGALSDWIFDRSGSEVLTWMRRVQIAVDVARGLNYLHNFTEPAHVHMNIRSSNILLDGDFRAKIANFGMVRSAEGKEGGFELTRHIVGMKGYMAPEYLENGLISPKLDVYAFGVLMLEMITGRRAVVPSANGDMFLSGTLAALLSEGDVKEKITDFTDPSIDGTYPVDSALSAARLIERCLKKDAASRPSMNEIEGSLSMILSASKTWESTKSEIGLESNQLEAQSQILKILIHPIICVFKKTIPMNLLLLIFFFSCFHMSNLNAQQRYTGNDPLSCNSQDKTDISPAFLYTCNGRPSCRAFVIIDSQPPYISVQRISELMSSDPLELARINSVSASATFPENKEVIVPVNCACSGQFYQANSSYTIQNDNETYFTIAKDLYKGLTTCASVMDENSYNASSLYSSLNLTVPLRCACPTSNQTEDGIQYLLSYPVLWGDNIPDVSKRFNVSENRTLKANEFSPQQDAPLVPFTTILIPLQMEPQSSQLIIHFPPTTNSPRFPVAVSKKPKKKFPVVIEIASAAGGSLLTIFAVLTIAFFYKKRRDKDLQSCSEKNKQCVVPEVLLDALSNMDRTIKIFTVEELQAATNDFSPSHKIRGSVYHGVIEGRAVAIKRTSNYVSEEVNLLNKINHFNLIRLHGISVGDENCYLINEYMENGSLKDWLCDKNCSSALSWTQRIQIALDVANGLHYLHSFTEPAYVHMDINTSNILLNSDLRAKIANFSLARSSEGKEGLFAETRHVVGTTGYMAPEHVASGLVTPKLDVYAFGVVMLELITGKDAIIEYDGEEIHLSTMIISAVEGEHADVELHELMDPNLHGRCLIDLALGFIKLAVACLRQNLRCRPSMDEVVSILSMIQTDSRDQESADVKL
ncbi:lysM domain receptor-like kinase 4 [Asimina triloba]